MAFTYQTRRGKTYYLHTGPKRGGGIQHFLSRDAAGPLAEAIPEGFEIHETPNGQVYLRRIKPALVRPEELEQVRRALAKLQSEAARYLAEVRDNQIVIHEGATGIDLLRQINVRLSDRDLVEYAARGARLTPVMRFILEDPAARIFAPERYCFRGSVEDWISIGQPDRLERLAQKFLKHLGTDAFYELF